MPYSAEITRANPAGILILIDQSGSMGQSFAGQADKRKADGVADAVNRLIQNLVLKSAKATGVRDYFHVGVIGYGAELATGLGGSIPDDVMQPISKVADKPLRIETRSKLVDNGKGELVPQPIRFPVWFDATAAGKTPMAGVFEVAEQVLKRFIKSHPGSFPPTVLNLTDGRPSDANPLPIVERVHDLATSDGNVLVFNLLISTEPTPPVFFPADESKFEDTYQKLLFRMSSELPPKLADAAKSDGYKLGAGARGLVLNADLTSVVRFLDIGTRVTTGMR